MNPFPVGFLAPPSAPAFIGSLDAYASGMFSCGGRKRLLASWAGGLYDVRDTTTSTVYTVGAMADGSEDTAAMLAAVGAHSVVVTKVYDQSGNGNHFEPSTSGREPGLASGTYLNVGFVTDGIDDDLLCVNACVSGPAKSIALSANYGTSGNIPFEYGDGSKIGVGTGALQSIQQYTGGSHMGSYIGHTGTGEYTFNNGVTGLNGTWLFAFVSATQVINQYHAGAADGVAGNNGSGCSTTDFPSFKWRLGRRTDSYAHAMSAAWFSMWDTDKSSNGAAISALPA